MRIELNAEELKYRVAEGQSLRVISAEMGISYGGLRHRLAKLGLKTVAAQEFVQTPGFRSGRKWTDAQLVDAVSKAKSIADVVRALGLSQTSAGNWETVKKHMSRLNLDSTHFLGQRWVADTARPTPSGRDLAHYMTENSTYSTSRLARRLVKEGIKQYVCEGNGCGISEWLGKPLSLELDHINGIHNDHRLENLRFLCPNCHAQTETWRGRNKRLNALAAAVE